MNKLGPTTLITLAFVGFRATPAQVSLPKGARSCTFELQFGGLRSELSDPHAGSRLVQVKIGDETLSMIFDTGAGATVLSKVCVKRLGLKTSGSVPALGTGKAVRAGLMRIPELTIATRDGGVIRCAKIRAIELELQSIANKLGHPIDGILGTAIFKDHPFCVDLHAKKVAVFSRGAFVPPKNASKHPLRLTTGIPCARFQLDGLRARWFILDTGNVGTFLMHPAVVRRCEIDVALRDLPSSRGHGVGGSQPIRYGRLRRTSIGALHFEGLPVSLVPEAKAGLFANASIAGNIGTGVMAHGRFTFDYRERSLWVEARSDEPVRYAPGLGLQLRAIDGVLDVGATVATSPARVAGVRQGDRIVEVAGEKIEGDAATLLRALREKAKIGVDCTIRVARGRDDKSRSLTLRRRPWIPQITMREKRR